LGTVYRSEHSEWINWERNVGPDPPRAPTNQYRVTNRLAPDPAHPAGATAGR